MSGSSIKSSGFNPYLLYGLLVNKLEVEQEWCFIDNVDIFATEFRTNRLTNSIGPLCWLLEQNIVTVRLCHCGHSKKITVGTLMEPEVHFKFTVSCSPQASTTV